MTENPDVSRMTIAVDCDESGIEQVEKQLNKLIPTIKVKVLEEGSYLARELTMIKVSCNSRQREEIMTLAELMHARIIDVTSTSLTLERSLYRKGSPYGHHRLYDGCTRGRGTYP